MMTNQNGSGPGTSSSSSSETVVHKRCTICNVPFINPDLINAHYRHHMTPKICVIVATDEDGNQKYVELTQQQAMAYNAGAFPIIQNVGGGQQQYIITDQGGNFKATTFDGGSQQLIATTYPQTSSNSLGTEVEMVQYVDSAGHELSQDEVQYYALDGQEYSVIQANEEIVVSTEARMPHEEQQLVIEDTAPQVAMAPAQQVGKAKGRAAKRKNSASGEAPKTYSRRGGGQQQQQQQQQQQARGVAAKKLLLADDQSTFSVSSGAASAKQVQSLQQQHHLLQQQGGGAAQMTVPVSAISFVTSTGHVTSANHIDLQHVTSDQFLSPSSVTGEEIVVSHASPSKLKSEPVDLITSGESRDHNHSMASLEAGAESYHQSSELKPLGLKVDPNDQLLQHHQQQQQQQYIVLAYDNEGGIHQIHQGSKPNVTVVEGFDIKEEKVTV